MAALKSVDALLSVASPKVTRGSRIENGGRTGKVQSIPISYIQEITLFVCIHS
jgi:hypothetical protein